MRQISPELGAHLGGQVTTICRCWKITRRDGEVLGFSEHDSELEIDAITYQPMSGLDATVAQNSVGLNANSVEVLGALTSQKLSTEDIRANKYDGARVDVFVVNWTEPSEYLLENVYFVGEITEEDGLFKAELRTLESELDQTRGEYFISQCQADLGDTRCGVDLENPLYLGTGAITNYDGLRQITTSGLDAFSAHWFEGGLLTWLTGDNAGVSTDISQHLISEGDAVLQLWKMQPGDIKVSDTFEVRAGCDKKFATCKTKFSNPLNFRGFPHLPGSDFALSYAGNSELMDGGIIVK